MMKYSAIEIVTTYNLKFAKLQKGITSQFALKRMKMQTSRPVVLEVFFTFLPYKPKHRKFLPNKDHKW